jgi:hypothetical protein
VCSGEGECGWLRRPSNARRVPASAEKYTEGNMVEPKIINIKTLFKNKLAIPEYQRPYKWDNKNCNELFFDIKNAFDAGKSAYRLGNIILHTKKNGILDVVDGQQRIITLLLLLKELGYTVANFDIKVVSHNHTLVNLKGNRDLFTSLINELFSSLPDIQDGFRDYILNKCEVVFIVTQHEYQAFQMFDSQNSRGKELDPRDLLKAFHLRELSPHISVDEKKEIDRRWVNNTEKINALFARVLYPIKAWAKGESGIDPLKFHIDEFKGISRFNELNKYHNYARQLIYARNYVENYNNGNMTNISYNVMHKMAYPFQLTGEILNGETFFEMIFHYCDLFDKISNKLHKYAEIPIKRTKLQLIYESYGEKNVSAQVLNKYEQSYCKYVTRLFYNLLLVYVDRFGLESEEFEAVVKRILKYALSLRLDYSSLREVSYLNFAKGDSNERISFANKNVCRFILNCRSSKDFMQFNICNAESASLVDKYFIEVKNEARKD